MIKLADKGSAVVILSKEDYLREAERQLNNTTNYQQVERYPTEAHATKVKELVKDMFRRGLLDKHTKNYLIPHQPRAARFYFFPKIHKPGNPGHPIVFSNGVPTENISAFMDYHLCPLVTNIPSYIQDTTDFLRKLQDLPTLPGDTLLATFNVSFLYTNIPHTEGIDACREALDPRETCVPPTRDLCQLIQIILTTNNFIFNGQHYLQTQVTAIGTRMAPSYANIFMGRLEKELLTTHHQQPLVWWRYIDDVFAVCTHGEPQLQAFLDHLNSHNHTIKFTAEWSRKEVSYLDAKVLLEDGKIRTDLHCKLTETHQHLQWSSCHPRHYKTSIPYSQALRLRRICSQKADFRRRTGELKQHLQRRGYQEAEVEKAIQQAMTKQRVDCLQPQVRKTDNTRTPLVVTYHSSLPPLGNITCQHQHLLQLSERMKRVISAPPIIAYHRPKNLCDLLT